jgi:hypothetical protein
MAHARAALSVDFDHHPAGEYTFTPTGLALSVCFARCHIETLFDGRSWKGLSIRGDVNVMPAGDRRVFRHHQGCRFALIAIDERQIAAAGPGTGSAIRPQGWLRMRRCGTRSTRCSRRARVDRRRQSGSCARRDRA